MIDDSPNQILERIKKQIEEEHARQRIICPNCHHVQDDDSMYHHVSYWGEDEEFEMQCEHCEEKFMCKEEVQRQFMCRKLEDSQ